MMRRFTAGVVLLGWAACAAYPLGLLLAATPADFSALRMAFVAIDWYPRLVTPTQVQHLGGLLALVLLVLAGAGLALLHADWPHRRQLACEWAAFRRRVGRAWGQLAAGQRRGLVAGLLALVGGRLLLSWWLAPDDDIYSYRVFVRQSLLVVSTCYPVPNNHVLTNSISRVFYVLHPGFWWSMRLPVVVLGTAGTLGWYVLLLLRTNFRVASLAVGAFSCLQLSLFTAASGRGYWLVAALSALGFESVLALSACAGRHSRRRRSRQLPWLTLALLGPLGLYAIPTFAYFLFSAYSWLLGCWVGRAAWLRVAQLALLGGGTLLAAGLLYAPILLVSGFEAVGYNPYVRPAVAAAAYWQNLPAELWVMEGRLLLEKHVGGLLVLVVLAAAGYLAWRDWQATGRRAVPWLPLLALWCGTSPYLLMAAQRVRAPERTLLYKSQFLFLLGALVVEHLRAQPWLPPWWRRSGWALLGGWLLVQFVLLYRLNASILAYGQPAGSAPGGWSVLRHFFHLH